MGVNIFSVFNGLLYFFFCELSKLCVNFRHLFDIIFTLKSCIILRKLQCSVLCRYFPQLIPLPGRKPESQWEGLEQGLHPPTWAPALTKILQMLSPQGLLGGLHPPYLPPGQRQVSAFLPELDRTSACGVFLQGQ